MRSRASVVVIVAALALTLVPGSPAKAQPGDTLFQSAAGEVILPTRFANTSNGSISGGFPGLGRRLWLAYAGGTNNLVSDVFDVDPETWGGRFNLNVTGGATGAEDIGVFFYSDFGTINAVFVGDPGAPCSVGEYDQDVPGGETGVVPHGATKALVFMTDGLDAFFSYEGYTPPSVPITADGFGAPLSIQAGQTVVWVNEDSAFHTVTSTDIDPFTEAPLFDSSPNHPNQPIGQGSTYEVTFNTEGTFGYVDQYTGMTGSVTVTGQAPTGAC